MTNYFELKKFFVCSDFEPLILPLIGIIEVLKVYAYKKGCFFSFKAWEVIWLNNGFSALELSTQEEQEQGNISFDCIDCGEFKEVDQKK